MSETEQEIAGPALDWPNQQVVREDGSGPGVDTQSDVEPQTDPLDAMTKSELLEHAEEEGVDVDASMTKAEIRDAIVEAEQAS
jgi:hypothetical protein